MMFVARWSRSVCYTTSRTSVPGWPKSSSSAWSSSALRVGLVVVVPGCALGYQARRRADGAVDVGDRAADAADE
jgi:hypothetical protein